MVAAYFLTDWIIWAMTEPIRVAAEQRGEDVSLMIDTVTGAFDLRLRISFAVGIIISAPVWLWQLWAFLMPGLTRKKIRYTIGFVAAAIPLFFAGCFVGWWVTPHIVEIMASFTPDGAANWFQVGFAGLATPAADIVSMLLLVGILVVLFFAAAGLSMLFDRRRAKRARAELGPLA